MAQKPVEERLAVFENMAASDPENELAHFSLGKVRLEMGQLAEAASSFRRTLELNPQHALAHRHLGEALLAQGNREAAVEVLRAGAAIAHAKGEWKPRNEMQDLLRQAGSEPAPLSAGEPSTKDSAPQASSKSDATRKTGEWSCRRCGNAGARLVEPPFPSPLGAEIQDRICQACWREWVGVSIKVINEYRLNLMLPEAQEIYDTHLREFLGL